MKKITAFILDIFGIEKISNGEPIPKEELAFFPDEQELTVVLGKRKFIA